MFHFIDGVALARKRPCVKATEIGGKFENFVQQIVRSVLLSFDLSSYENFIKIKI